MKGHKIKRLERLGTACKYMLYTSRCMYDKWYTYSYVYKYLKGRGKEDGARYFLKALSDRTRGSGNNLKHKRFCLNIQAAHFHSGSLSIDIGCPETRRRRSPPWRCSKAVWILSWKTCCRWPCLRKWVEQDNFWKSLAAIAILWSFKTKKVDFLRFYLRATWDFLSATNFTLVSMEPKAEEQKKSSNEAYT